MNFTHLIEVLGRYPVFTAKDIASAVGGNIGYAHLVAYRLKNRKLISEIEKGKYTVERDPFAIASWIIWPSYISGAAALNYYGLMEQLPFTIDVVTTVKRKKKKLQWGGAKIEFIVLKKERFFGFERRSYHGKTIFIAEKEKALVDALATGRMPLSEAIDIIKNNRRKLNMKRLSAYAKRMATGPRSTLVVKLHDKQ